MEWWRLTTSSDSADVGAPRFKVFNSWGKLVSLIALCVPSSAAVEGVSPCSPSVEGRIKIICYMMNLRHQ